MFLYCSADIVGSIENVWVFIQNYTIAFIKVKSVNSAPLGCGRLKENLMLPTLQNRELQISFIVITQNEAEVVPSLSCTHAGVGFTKHFAYYYFLNESDYY